MNPIRPVSYPNRNRPSIMSGNTPWYFTAFMLPNTSTCRACPIINGRYCPNRLNGGFVHTTSAWAANRRHSTLSNDPSPANRSCTQPAPSHTHVSPHASGVNNECASGLNRDRRNPANPNWV